MAKKLSQGQERALARNIQGGTGALTQRSLNAAKTSANQVAFNSVADPVGTFGGTKADFTNKKGGSSGPSKEQLLINSQQGSSPVGVISSAQGQSTLNEYKKRDEQIRTGAGTDANPLTDIQIQDFSKQGILPGDVVKGKGILTKFGTFQPEAVAPEKVADSSATFLNPETEQTEVVTGDRATVDAAIANPPDGMSLAESNLTGKSAPSKEMQEAIDSVAVTTKALEEITRNFERSMVSDKEMKSEVLAISRQWVARKKTMEDITMRQTKGLSTQLMRSGGRFVAGTTGGIISESERLGVLKIGELQAQKESAIIQAKQAIRNFNYQIYTDLMDSAEALQDQKVAELAILREAQQVKDEEIAEEKKTSDQQMLIAEAIDEGYTSSIDVFSALDGKVPFDKVREMMEAVDEETGIFTGGADETIRLGPNDSLVNAKTGERLASGIGTGGGSSNFNSSSPSSQTPGSSSLSGGTTTVSYVHDETGETYSYELPNEATVDEARDIRNIIRQLPIKLKDNVAEKPILIADILLDLRDGLAMQDIANLMKGFVLDLKGGADAVLGEEFLSLALGTLIEPGDLSAQMNMGRHEQAMRMVENAQLENVDTPFGDTDSTRGLIVNVNRVTELINKVPVDKLGAIDKAAFKFQRLSGIQLSTEEEKTVQKLETSMQTLSGSFRLGFSGQQLTETEKELMDSLTVSLSDQPEIAITKAGELSHYVTGLHNQARSQRGLPVATSAQLINDSARLVLYETRATEFAAKRKKEQYSSTTDDSLLNGFMSSEFNYSSSSSSGSSGTLNGYPTS